MVANAQEGNSHAAALAIASTETRHAYLDLLDAASSIGDLKLRAATLEMLRHPVPRFLTPLSELVARDKVRAELVAAGLLDAGVTTAALFPPLSGVQPFDAAPGGPPGTHHAYPGGLAQHTAFNLQTALDLERRYRTFYGIESIDHDLVAAAAILHDAIKPYCLQWKSDATTTTQATIAGAPSHHVFIIAEAFHRGFSNALIVALAAAHQMPAGEGADKVVAWLRAGAILAGADPVAMGLLKRENGIYSLARPASLEAAINHLSDHDYVIGDAAAPLVEESLARGIRAATSGNITDTRMRWAMMRIESQLPALRLYALWRNGGDAAIAGELVRHNVPWLTPEDQ